MDPPLERALLRLKAPFPQQQSLNQDTRNSPKPLLHETHPAEAAERMLPERYSPSSRVWRLSRRAAMWWRRRRWCV